MSSQRLQNIQLTGSSDSRQLFLAFGLLVFLVGGATRYARADDTAISFNNDVRPILSDKCFHCHGPDESGRAAGLRLDVRDDAIDYGAIVVGEPDASLLIERIESEDDDLRMPPPHSKKTLTSEQKQTLRDWIAGGAEYAKHWSFNPLPESVEPPLPNESWPRSTLDQFILRKLRAAGLSPNAEADREAWLRRVTFDLTGLPPTLEEIASFREDHSDEAYERVVDRLLMSTAYAERMASEWLDVARYSDSYGYQRDDERFVWPWRDWVINAFRQNQPYDEFVTWQLAGDLLPGATREQRLATTFCRLHSHKKEGGVAVEEFRIENVADRTHTFASAFLGLTMECARCHDHKYDPISSKNYYELTSFFANLDERGLISYFTDATPTPAMPLPSPEQEAQLAQATEDLGISEQDLATVTIEAKSRFEQWLENLDSFTPKVAGLVARVTFDELIEELDEELLYDEDTGFVEVEKKSIDLDTIIAFANEVETASPAISGKANRVVDGVSGKALELTGDDSVRVPQVGQIERHQPITVSLWIRPAEIEERGVIYRHSGGWDDCGSMGYALVKRGARLRANFVHFWPGNAICVETDDILQPGEWRHVTVTYDGSSKADGLRIYIDGKDSQAHIVQDQLTRTIHNWRGGYNELAVGSRYRDRGFKDGTVDDWRVYDRELSAIEVRHELDGKSLTSLCEAAATGRLSDRQRDELQAYYLATVDEPTRSSRARLQQAREAWNRVMDSIPSITVMEEQAEPRPAYLLTKGAYDAHGEEVFAGTPDALPPFPEEQPANRLGLARWLFDPDHPLTARVAVNRYWQMLFGTGLVRTPEDFGSQGAPPSHPELLDWLARDFVESGWDIRRLMRMMVLSSTYRQSTVVDTSVRQRDPENILLSRGPSKRLSAEMVRDNALMVSGLLIDRVGGPPVKPYDLPLAYTPVDADTGQGLYRRSLYTFWKRTSPSPIMMTMNASRREVCMLKREVTSSPLQALVLLNGTQFIEAARVFAGRLLQEHGADVDGVINEAFESLTSRRLNERERDVLRAAYQEQLQEFESRPELAEELLEVGAAPRAEGLAAPVHAATTVLVNSIMNIDEGMRCR